MLYNTQRDAFEFFVNYSRFASEAKYKATHGKRKKMLTPELIIEKLPIALACVKAHNTSLHLVDKIRQFICSLLREKEITN